MCLSRKPASNAGPRPLRSRTDRDGGKKAVMFHKSDSRSAKPRHCYNCLLFRQILHISHSTHLTQQALYDAVSLRFSFSEHLGNCHRSSIDPKIGHTSVVQKISTSEISLVFITVGRFIYFSLADAENSALYSFTKSESCVQRRSVYKFGSCSKTQKYILNHNWRIYVHYWQNVIQTVAEKSSVLQF